MSKTATPFTMRSTHFQELGHPTVGRPILACQWRLDGEGQISGRWLPKFLAADAEQCALNSADSSAVESQVKVQPAGHLQAVISWIVISAMLAMTVLGSVACFTIEPSGLL